MKRLTNCRNIKANSDQSAIIPNVRVGGTKWAHYVNSVALVLHKNSILATVSVVIPPSVWHNFDVSLSMNYYAALFPGIRLRWGFCRRELDGTAQSVLVCFFCLLYITWVAPRCSLYVPCDVCVCVFYTLVILLIWRVLQRKNRKELGTFLSW